MSGRKYQAWVRQSKGPYEQHNDELDEGKTLMICFSVSEDGIFKCIKWGVTLPLSVLLYYTVPDCRLKRSGIQILCKVMNILYFCYLHDIDYVEFGEKKIMFSLFMVFCLVWDSCTNNVKF